MQKRHKDLLRTLVRELRHRLVGSISPIDGTIERGNLDRELERLGISPDGTVKPIDALPHSHEYELYAYRVAAAQLSALSLSDRPAIRSEIIERAAYTWINRLLALRAMEVRGLIDSTLRGDEAYGGISEKLFLLRDTQHELAAGEDGGWWAVIEETCTEQALSLPGLFSLNDPVAALRPSGGILVQCVTLIGGTLPGFTLEESDATFLDPDAIGWAYQFYQEENKALIYAKLGKGGKATSRSEIAAATQLFTEPYMVQWLLQNSLGRSYHEAYPNSKLPETWPYYVQPEHLDTSTSFTLPRLTLLDPCVGSGHFLRAAFDMFVAMYREQFPTWTSIKEIASRILADHLHGIDLDPRATQLTALTLYLRAWELIRDERQQQYLPGPGSYIPPAMNLATTPTNLNKGALDRHLQRHPDDDLFRPLIEEIFAGLEQAEILGSLLRPREYLDNAILALQKQQATQRSLFSSVEMDDLRVKIAEMAKSDPGELKKIALQRVVDSFKAEADNVDDVSAMLFGREAEQGVRLLQLLDRQYAVVVTNPPYMGSKNMDGPLKKYIEKHYSAGKRDLYATFILRCLDLCQFKGRVAMVTMQSWMFLRSFAEMRAISQEKVTSYTREHKFSGLLRETSIDVLAHLGSHAFEEIGGEVVQSAMFVFSNKVPSKEHKMAAFRLVGIKSAIEKAILLQKTETNQKKLSKYIVAQENFISIPESPIVYWQQKLFFDLLSGSYRLKDFADIRQGLATTDNSRFTRCSWEVQNFGSVRGNRPISGQWFWYAKGGGYQKWSGLEWLVVNWLHDGAAIKTFVVTLPGTTHWSRRVASENYYFHSCLVYTQMSGGSMGPRFWDDGLFDVKSVCIYHEKFENLNIIAAILSSRYTSYMLRSITQNLEFHAGYTSRLPVIPDIMQNQSLATLANVAKFFKALLESKQLTERIFDYKIKQTTIYIEAISCILCTIEGSIEKTVNVCLKLTPDFLKEIYEETSIPSGFYPLINNYDILPILAVDSNQYSLPQEIFDHLVQCEHISIDSKELAHIKTNLRSLYEAGPGAKNVEQEEDNTIKEEGNEEESIVLGANIPVPTETFLEELSVKMQIHPISIYRLLEELRKEGVRCKPEEQRILEDRLSVLILRLLGHRWPKQIEAEEPVPTWAARNGILPLVSVPGKTTLADRLRERLREEDESVGAQKTENLLEELTGLNLEEWLRRRFFSRHTSQFKSRPVAWHLASTPGKAATGKGKKSRGGAVQRKPAFECILYYHASPNYALARIRNEYVEPLIQSERGKIERDKRESSEGALFQEQDTTSSAIASERIRELNEFVEKLRIIEEQGFSCPELQQVLANESLDRWCGDGYLPPLNRETLIREEEGWHVDINDGVRVNIAPLQLAGLLASDVLKTADARKAIADRARWRSDERCWVREGKLPRCGWLQEQVPASQKWQDLEPQRAAEQYKLEQKRLLLQQGQHVDDVDTIEEEEVLS